MNFMSTSQLLKHNYYIISLTQYFSVKQFHVSYSQFIADVIRKRYGDKVLKECYLPFIGKDFVTHMHGVTGFLTRVLFLLETYLQKTLEILTYVFNWFCFISCLSSFSLSITSFFFYTVFVAISQTPNEAHSVFGDYNLPHKDWLTYFNKTDRTGELCYNLSISHQGFIQTILMSVNTKNLTSNCVFKLNRHKILF